MMQIEFTHQGFPQRLNITHDGMSWFDFRHSATLQRHLFHLSGGANRQGCGRIKPFGKAIDRLLMQGQPAVHSIEKRHQLIGADGVVIT